jgi:HTH-type transcriptional regulator/antitoxin HigA
MSKLEYDKACKRIEKLLTIVGDETSTNDIDFIELDFLSNLVSDYEEKYFK